MHNTQWHAWHKGGDSMPLLPCHSSLSQPQGRTVLVTLHHHLLLFLDGASKQQMLHCPKVSLCSTIGSIV